MNSVFVRISAPLNSRLYGIAREDIIRVAVKYHPIIGRRPEIGLGKRPTPIEADTVMRTGARQLKTIVHSDRGKSARLDRLGAGVVIHELVYAAIAIGGNTCDQVVDTNLGGSIRLWLNIDNHMALARAGDGQSGRQQGALVGGNAEAHGFIDHLMVVAGSRGSR